MEMGVVCIRIKRMKDRGDCACVKNRRRRKMGAVCRRELEELGLVFA